MNFKRIVVTLSMCGTLLGYSTATFAQLPAVQYFQLDQVRLLESPFLRAQNTDLDYILEMDADRLLAPYMKEAGLTWEAENYGNWENTGLDGHIGGHYLSALSLMYASTGDQQIKERLDYMLDHLQQAQENNGNGYLGGVPDGKTMWEEIRSGKIEAGNFSLNQKWVPLYNIHKIFAGLKDAYQFVGSEKAKAMLLRLSDWFVELTKGLSEEQFQEMLISEHGGLNEVFADVAVISGDSKYLELAEKMSHRVILAPLAAQRDNLTGMHANTQIPKVIGFQRIAQLSDDPSWNLAASFFWDNVVNQRSVSIGGNSVREHFHPIDDFSSMLSSDQGPETCNSYNMLRLSEKLFQSNPDRKYMDYYERALYNHILSSQHPIKGGFVYFTPMRPRHYRVYSQVHNNFWCCVGSGIENHAKYGQVIYANSGEDIYVNLFIPSELNWEEKGIKLIQNTEFPYNEESVLEFQLRSPKEFNLKIRYPDWVKPGAMRVEINGMIVPVQSNSEGYINLSRSWQSDDQVKIHLPMETRLEYLQDGSGWASFVHGPVVLAAESGQKDLKGIFADDSRMGHVASGEMYPLEETTIIVQENSQPVPDKISGDLKFKLTGNLFPETGKTIELVPFFTIHESRYQLYWPIATPNQINAIKSVLRSKDELVLKLEALTVDQVAPGEQQPEAEHDFKGEQTRSGHEDGVFWRNTQSWFSYVLRNPEQKGKILRISYGKQKNGNPFSILVNDQLLKQEKFDPEISENKLQVDYDLSGFEGDSLHVRFVSIDGLETEKVFYVRLLESRD